MQRLAGQKPHKYTNSAVRKWKNNLSGGMSVMNMLYKGALPTKDYGLRSDTFKAILQKQGSDVITTPMGREYLHSR